MDKVDYINTKREDLPQWLLTLWAIKPELAEKAEIDYVSLKKQLAIQGVVKSLNSSLQIGDDVLYVGKHLGTIVKDRNVELRDGTLIASLDTQPHKFRKVI